MVSENFLRVTCSLEGGSWFGGKEIGHLHKISDLVNFTPGYVFVP